MATTNPSLKMVYEGWEGYQISLVDAIKGLSHEQLAYRPAPNLRSLGEIANHISLGRIDWFQRMDAPGSNELANEAKGWEPEKAITENAAELVRRLEASWRLIDNTLNAMDRRRPGTNVSATVPGENLRGLLPVDHLAHHGPRYPSWRSDRCYARRAGNRYT